MATICYNIYLMNKYSKGFTVIEVSFIIVVMVLAATLFFVQKNNLQVSSRDDERKSSINAIFYSLEEVFYEKNKFYPSKISETNIKSVDPDVFIDPQGFKLGEPESNYRYEPTECNNEKCYSYTLRTTLEAEDDFIKENRN